MKKHKYTPIFHRETTEGTVSGVFGKHTNIYFDLTNGTTGVQLKLAPPYPTKDSSSTFDTKFEPNLVQTSSKKFCVCSGTRRAQ